MAKRAVLLTVVGNDRPGIVERITREVVARAGNVEQSRSARLAGQFASFLVVSVKDGDVGALERALAGLSADGLQVSTRPVAEHTRIGEGYVAHQLEVRGADHEGIIHELCQLLAAQHVNIAEMSTDVTPSPGTGTPMFSMDATLELPPSVAARELKKALGELADRLAVDFMLRVQG